MNHKRKKPRKSRAGCIMCKMAKVHGRQGLRGGGWSGLVRYGAHAATLRLYVRARDVE